MVTDKPIKAIALVKHNSIIRKGTILIEDGNGFMVKKGQSRAIKKRFPWSRIAENNYVSLTYAILNSEKFKLII